MNIQVQMCGLVISLLLMVFYLHTNRLHLYREKLFLTALVVTIINISLDILSVIAIYYRDITPIYLVRAVCKIYLTAIVWQLWTAIAYISADAFTEIKHIRFKSIFAVFAVIACILILALPIGIFSEGNVIYTYGPSVISLYITAALSIATVIVFTFVFRKKTTRRRLFAVHAWMLLWLVAMAIQFFNNELLIVGFAASLGMVILYFALENPESNIQRQYGCFNAVALRGYLAEMYETGKPFAAYNILLNTAKKSEIHGNDFYQNFIKKILEVFSKYDGIYIFKSVNMNLFVIANDDDMLTKAIDEARGSLATYVGIDHGIVSVHMSDGHIVEDSDEFIEAFSFAESHCGVYSIMGTVYSITEKDIETLRNRTKMIKEISLAVAEDRIEVFYQPIYNARTKSFNSAEALARLRRKDGTIVPPGLFIPVAEESGQILEVGKIVFDKCCKLLAAGEVVDNGIDFIEVNLSIIQSENAKLPDVILGGIEKYGLRPDQIVLEITETASIARRDMLIHNINYLSEKGIAFALDDFGKGESNLMYVVDMPFKILKFDLDMTKAVHTMPRAVEVVAAAEKMAHNLSMSIVAEGIETEHELNTMIDFNTDRIQGYYFSKPLPEREFIEFIKQNNTK